VCLGIPMKIIRIEGDFAWVKTAQLTRQINVQMVPRVRIGDYVIVHAGFAIEIISQKQAAQTLSLFRQIK